VLEVGHGPVVEGTVWRGLLGRERERGRGGREEQ